MEGVGTCQHGGTITPYVFKLWVMLIGQLSVDVAEIKERTMTLYEYSWEHVHTYVHI